MDNGFLHLIMDTPYDSPRCLGTFCMLPFERGGCAEFTGISLVANRVVGLEKLGKKETEKQGEKKTNFQLANPVGATAAVALS